jgi:hypothetical protein
MHQQGITAPLGIQDLVAIDPKSSVIAVEPLMDQAILQPDQDLLRGGGMSTHRLIGARIRGEDEPVQLQGREGVREGQEELLAEVLAVRRSIEREIAMPFRGR